MPVNDKLLYLQSSDYRLSYTYAEYSSYRKGRVNPGNNLQINEKLSRNRFNSRQ